MIITLLSRIVWTILLLLQYIVPSIVIATSSDSNDINTNNSNDLWNNICFQQFPFMDKTCWITVLVKGLGIAIILGACLSKVPFMLNLIQTKSATGLSRSASYGEVISTYI